MKQKQETKQVKRLQKELNQTKAAFKEAVRNWDIAKKQGEVLQKMLDKSDNRFLQALDLISSLEEENAQLKAAMRK